VPEIVDAAKLLRAGVLDELGVLIAGARDGAQQRSPSTFGALAASACASLGARVYEWSADAGGGGQTVPDGVDRLIVDAAALYDAGEWSGREQAGAATGAGDGAAGAASADTGASAGTAASAASASRAALRACLDGAWEASHAVANAAFIEPRRPGRIVYVAPPSGRGRAAEGALAEAACAGLENLARTLSIEWARYEITAVAIAPGASTAGEEVAALCAYLASPAGAYFSGCLLDLRGTPTPPARA
jgi:NAD(P)-dependent dehydrogenase (short-subunit alcohol dehydrogenase family)